MNSPLPQPHPPSTKPTTGYPLSLLFMLTTVFAILAALVTPLAKLAQGSDMGTSWSPRDVVLLVLAGGLIGCINGLILGLWHHNIGRGISIGVPTGLVVGVMSGAVLASSFVYAKHVLFVSMGSAIFLLTLATFFRYINNRDPVSQPAAYQALLERRQDARDQ